MSARSIVAIYLGMLLFDIATMAGTAYLTGWCGWSNWWWALAMLLLAGSNPRRLIEASKGQP